MTTGLQQGTLLDVLKKKMRQTKEEMEKYKDDCEDFQKRLQGEVLRREDVSCFFSSSSVRPLPRHQRWSECQQPALASISDEAIVSLYTMFFLLLC